MYEKGEGYTHSFYPGADYGEFRDEYSLNFGVEYKPNPSEFGFTTDPRTSNQIKAVSDKLNTGAKTIEFSGVTPQILEAIPEQHLTEVNRLKKLVGADLTFHGPILEPTGISRQGWDEYQREQVERQMWSAVSRAHKLDPKGNIVVTFHSGAINIEPEVVVKEEMVNPKTGKKETKEQLKELFVVDEASGRFQSIPMKPDYFKSKEGIYYENVEKQRETILDQIQKQNKETWFKQLQGVSFHANQGAEIVNDAISGRVFGEKAEKLDKEALLELYQSYLEGKEEAKGILEKGPAKEIASKLMQRITHGDLYLRDAYQDLQNLFNIAYETAQKNNSKEDLKKLNQYREEMKQKLDYIEKPEKVNEFAEEIVRGVTLLRSIEPPRLFKPVKEFAIDKSSDTFSNIAFNAYKNFKDSAPIISIENPPAGTAPLYRAEDLRDLIKSSREKLKEKLVSEMNFSEGEAKKQAEKLMGATWDVGHINMLRKFGYGEKEIIEQTKKIAPFVKHVHLSDNFGMDHTELPMGMGNVPTKPMMEAIAKYNKQVKKIVETGGPWFEHFKVTPFRETLRAFGSPVYPVAMAPYWNQVAGMMGGYFSGYGPTLPEQHFATYGAGFSNLPPELGGQMGGRSRVGGTPTE